VSDWTEDELDRVGNADELEIASYRADGTLRPYVTIWTVRAGDGLYVRSAHGANNPWYRRALASGRGRIRAGGVDRDVRFADVEPGEQDAIDAAYHTKYDHYGAKFVGPVVGPDAHGQTIRLVAA
jgi:hypothetical protein